MTVRNDHRLGDESNRTLLPLSPGDQMSELKVSSGLVLSGSSRGGSLLPLPASGGSRRPWARGPIPPVSAFHLHGAYPLCLGLSSSVS